MDFFPFTICTSSLCMCEVVVVVIVVTGTQIQKTKLVFSYLMSLEGVENSARSFCSPMTVLLSIN